MERGLEDMSSILKVEDLVKYYGEGENQVRAVDHTSLQIERGKFTERIKTISKSSKKNLTLYAKWQKVTVKKSAIKKMKAVSGRKAKVTVQKVEGAAGYQIVYSTDKQFKKNVKKVTISGTSKTLGKLAKGKTYYVKVRAYKKDSTGAKVYGSFSSAKKIKISK